jgi:hypothetical protein
MPQKYKSAKRAMKKPAMSHGNKPKAYGKPKMKNDKLKKQKTQDIKVSRGVTMGINLGGGRALVGLDLSGHKKKSNKPNPYQKSLDKGKKKPNAKFPDLSGDGKVTKKDILMGRGVIDKPKMLKNKRKDVAGKAMMSYAKPAMYGDKPKMYDKPKGYVSDAQRKAVHASKEDGGKGNPNKPKMAHGKKPKMGRRISNIGRKTKELGLTGAAKDKRVETVGGKSTLTKTKTRVGGAKT